ncbi:MAG: riboflavin biosynthesis protein RibF [bacterium]
MLMIYRYTEDLDKNERRVITVGNFDGFHKAHKKVIEKLLSVSNQNKLEPLVITFYPHPRRFFGNREFKLIQTLSERLKTIIENGADSILVLQFKEIADLDIDQFIEKILIEKLSMTHLVVGSGNSLGRGATIIDERIEELSERLGFSYDLIREMNFEGRRISSSLIRELIDYGKIREANNILCKQYTISGPVISGKGLSKRGIFRPTINIGVARYKLIPMGVFAGWTYIGGVRYQSVVNCGPSPTFGILEDNIETHVIDWEGEVEKRVSVELVEKIREQKRFRSIEDLREEIEDDIERAREMLDKEY